jgi:UDP-N-acetylglucosamine acyltransferase
MTGDNQISEFSHILGKVNFGTGNFIGPGAVVIGPVTIGNNNYFGPNCVIGTPPQDDKVSIQSHKVSSLGNPGDSFEVQIGDNNVIREFVTVHKGLTSPTKIGNNCYLMSYAHVAHDCNIYDNVKIANNVQMGGYTSILEGAYIGLSAVLHQFCVIGQYSMIGMGSTTVRNILPTGLAIGSPSRVIKINKVALENLGIRELDWAVKFIENPDLDTVHPSLRKVFLEYLAVVDFRSSQRKEISILRSLKR